MMLIRLLTKCNYQRNRKKRTKIGICFQEIVLRIIGKSLLPWKPRETNVTYNSILIMFITY